MRDEADHTRRWLINASGAAILSGAIPATASHAQTAAAPALGAVPAPDGAREAAGDPVSVSPATTALADYVAGALDRALPAEVVARTKLHVLDTLAAMVSGSRLKPEISRPVMWTASVASRRRW